MLETKETHKVDNNEIRKAVFVNVRPLNMWTGTRYLENIPELVQVCRSSVVNK